MTTVNHLELICSPIQFYVPYNFYVFLLLFWKDFDVYKIKNCSSNCYNYDYFFVTFLFFFGRKKGQSLVTFQFLKEEIGNLGFKVKLDKNLLLLNIELLFLRHLNIKFEFLYQKK
jgi:hypothetical protein